MRAQPRDWNSPRCSGGHDQVVCSNGWHRFGCYHQRRCHDALGASGGYHGTCLHWHSDPAGLRPALWSRLWSSSSDWRRAVGARGRADVALIHDEQRQRSACVRQVVFGVVADRCSAACLSAARGVVRTTLLGQVSNKARGRLKPRRTIRTTRLHASGTKDRGLPPGSPVSGQKLKGAAP